MSRILLGALAALLFVSVGLFWVQGRAETEEGLPPPEPQDDIVESDSDDDADPEALPFADIGDMIGPAPPEATELTREQRRFVRYDRNNDGRISRNEMMATRTARFRSLDTDGNNLLTFEEWAVSTSERFHAADADGDLFLTPAEFATTAPKRRPTPKPKCEC